MKTKFIFILIVLFTFTFAFIGCNEPDDDDPVTGTVIDPAIIGKWVSKDAGEVVEEITIEFKVDKTFIISEIARGTYTASDKKITMTVTDIHKNLFIEFGEGYEFLDYDTLFSGEWISKTQIETLLTSFPVILAGMDKETLELIGISMEDIFEMMADITTGLDEMFKEHAGTYDISENGKTLTLKVDLLDEGEEEIILTKKE